MYWLLRSLIVAAAVATIAGALYDCAIGPGKCASAFGHLIIGPHAMMRPTVSPVQRAWAVTEASLDMTFVSMTTPIEKHAMASGQPVHKIAAPEVARSEFDASTAVPKNDGEYDSQGSAHEL